MMINPEGYYDEYLKGKNEQQLLTAIRGLKKEIGRLKNIMEASDYDNKGITMPSEITRLWCTRMYLNRAKQALADIGGKYVPSKVEEKVALFDASIPYISKLMFSIGGFFRGYKTYTITIDDKFVHFSMDDSLNCNQSHAIELPYNINDKTEFLDEIRELHIGEWKTSYVNHDILDGTQWDLTIEFSDGHKPFKTSGSNAFPYNFDSLQELLKIKYIDD